MSLPLETCQLTISQAQGRTRRCNLAQYGGSTAVCTQDGQETRACNPEDCRKSTALVDFLSSRGCCVVCLGPVELLWPHLWLCGGCHKPLVILLL